MPLPLTLNQRPHFQLFQVRRHFGDPAIKVNIGTYWFTFSILFLSESTKKLFCSWMNFQEIKVDVCILPNGEFWFFWLVLAPLVPDIVEWLFHPHPLWPWLLIVTQSMSKTQLQEACTMSSIVLLLTLELELESFIFHCDN